MNSRNPSIDLAKLIASWMIVAIHTGLFSDINETLYFAVIHVLCRIAVPFFAICSGYFLGKKCIFERNPESAEANGKVFWKQWKKLVLIYAFWTVVYLFVSIPNWIKSGWFSAWAFVDYVVAAFTKGPYYHLWYLLGMIYVLPMCYIVICWIHRKYWTGMTILLWICEIFGYAYGYVFSVAPEWIMDVLSRFDVFIRLLSLLLTGMMISQKEINRGIWCLTGFMISFVLLFGEAFALKSVGQEAVSYIFFTLPTAYFLFNCIHKLKMKLPVKNTSRMAEISMVIYCIHPILVNLSKSVVPNSIIHFLLCTAGSTLLGWMFLLCKYKTVMKEG